MKSLVAYRMKTLIATMFLTCTVSNSLVLAAPALNVKDQTVQGMSGGSVDSKNCGFIAATPSYTMSLSQRVDYMRMQVEANGGQPTLLIVGPKKEDSFCVLGDNSTGLKPEISGVWEPGTYQFYVGDRNGERHQFTLNIFTNKN
jgi:hypothetical protein